jgi:LCP family protein required for cell wall assembly
VGKPRSKRKRRKINIKSLKVRIIKAFFSTIFFVFFSIIAYHNLAAGSPNTEPMEPIEKPTPNPYESSIVPNDEPIEEENFVLTNGQRYFEDLVDPQSTNILLLGTEPSGFNFDTIMILSISEKLQSVKIISLPRDIYIDYSDEILNAVKKVKPSYLKAKGIFRINAAPSLGDTISYQKNTGRFQKPYVDFIADLIQEIFGIHINDFVYVKPKGFRNIVDYFGGVSVYVPVLMNYSDPSQDFEVYIEKGTWRLNGKQAEGYVRFRQGYDENGTFHNYGDIFRKENQSRFIKAFISQHVTLKNLTKLGEIADVISANVITSVKGWDDIVDYGALAEKIVVHKYSIENVELQLTEKNIDGSSYVLLKTKDLKE